VVGGKTASLLQCVFVFGLQRFGKTPLQRIEYIGLIGFVLEQGAAIFDLNRSITPLRSHFYARNPPLNLKIP
jgi:hypothetical protein